MQFLPRLKRNHALFNRAFWLFYGMAYPSDSLWLCSDTAPSVGGFPREYWQSKQILEYPSCTAWSCFWSFFLFFRFLFSEVLPFLRYLHSFFQSWCRNSIRSYKSSSSPAFFQYKRAAVHIHLGFPGQGNKIGLTGYLICLRICKSAVKQLLVCSSILRLFPCGTDKHAACSSHGHYSSKTAETLCCSGHDENLIVLPVMKQFQYSVP